MLSKSRGSVVLLFALLAVSSGGFSPEAAAQAFPGYGILPKQETGALRFLAEHEAYDGRGVVVAIFDTGVDPGAPGLQTTSDGRPKVIDLVDGSGSGDVDTSTVRKAAAAKLPGLTGRTLRVPADWNNPSGKFHLGIKRAYELFPRRLVQRLEQRRKERFDSQHRRATAQVRSRLAAWDEAHPKPNEAQPMQREELVARLEVLTAAAEEYEDPGPVYDCVVFHDGETWRAAIDTDEDGDLADEKTLARYRLEREYATFGDDDLLNFGVNIYQDGKLLSIVTDCGAHGTHVAGIVGGNFPDQPELSGIAPGAQIVSVKIGDSRLGTNSTGTGLIRGIAAVLENQCDLINMSYGGSTSDPDSGRKVELLSELVNEHNVIFVASAGNGGPALSTVASPGGTASAILGVGAYVSPEMMEVGYSMRERLDELPYTWTSRGPALDGALGVDICAPGGAIAPVPVWVLQRNMLMNGTSMSSPNACGNIALLLSGLKKEGISYSPYSIRRALQNTARPIRGNDVFATGPGLLQVDAAFEHLRQHSGTRGEILRFEVTLPEEDGARGIYLREPHQLRSPREHTVRVQPKFRKQADNREKASLEMRLALESTALWIETPQHLLCNHGGRSFKLRVDPTRLPSGVSYGEVRAYDADQRDRGPLFRIPVTVTKCEHWPAEDDYRWTASLASEPGDIERRFLAVPPGATWCDVRIRAGELEDSRRLVLHFRQMLPRRGYSRSDHRHYLTVRADQEAVQSFPVVGGHTAEICLAQYWSSLGPTECTVEVTFHGLLPNDQELAFGPGRLTGRIEVTAPLRDEQLAPRAELTHHRRCLRPTDSRLAPLAGKRDLLPENRREHELLLTYEFEIPRETEVTPHPAITDQDEASASWESHLWQIFDDGKRLVASGAGADSAKLPEGKYTLRFHLRHDRADYLDKLGDMVLGLDRKLEKPLSLSVHADPDDALLGGAKFEARLLEKGERAVLYLALPTAEQLPEDAADGDALHGTLTWGKEDGQLTGAGRKPGGFPLRYEIIRPSKENDKDAPSHAMENEPKSPQQRLTRQVLETKLAFLGKLREEKKTKAFNELAETLLDELAETMPAEHAGYLQVRHEQLKLLDTLEDRKKHLPEIVEAADRIIQRIDQQQLALHFGRKIPSEDKQAVAKRKRMEQRRDLLIDAIYRKGRALAYMDLPREYMKPADRDLEIPRHPESKKERTELFEKNFAQLSRWVDTAAQEYFLLHARRERRHRRYGQALRLLAEHSEQAPTRKLLYKKRADIFDELGWNHLRDYERTWMLVQFPPAYPPF